MLPTLGCCAARLGQGRRGGYLNSESRLNLSCCLGHEANDRGDRSVRRFGRPELLGPHEIRHDPQYPLHECVTPHTDTSELAHDGGVADGAHKGTSDLEVEAVHLVEAL